MIQVDVFWSFATGCLFAFSAYHKLKEENTPFENRYFVYTVLYLSFLFSPSGTYLLNRFPGWETMMCFDRNIHAIWPTLFTLTNVLLGVIGFYISWVLIKSNRHLVALSLGVLSFAIMFAILGFGYARFLYIGTTEQWRQGITFPLQSWFHSEVFYTLCVMGIAILPAIYYPMFAWPQRSYAEKQDLKQFFVNIFSLYCSLGVVFFFIYLYVFGAEERNRLSDGSRFGEYVSLIGYGAWELLGGILIGFPIFIGGTTDTVQTKIDDFFHPSPIKSDGKKNN